MHSESHQMKVRIPVMLATMGEDQLSTEAQAQRMMAGLEQYDRVLLDFRGVAEIGPHFADHVFRRFTASHPGVHIDYANTTPNVETVIQASMR